MSSLRATPDDLGMDTITKGQDTMTADDRTNAEWAELKNEQARWEAAQERAAFANDPDRDADVYDFLATYTGTFPFLVSVASRANAATRNLTPGQVAAVRKCMKHDAPATPATPARVAVTEPGVYRDADGTIFKVQKSRGSDRLYAKRLTDLNPGQGDRINLNDDSVRFTFDYAPGAVFNLTADMRMDEADAKAFGLRYGICVSCGKRLTVRKSVERAIGPVCIKWFRW